MADNIAITAGAGTTVHTDEYTHGTLGSGNTQLVKLVSGTLDSDTAVGVADIGVKANALRVCPASDVTDATYIGDIKFGEALKIAGKTYKKVSPSMSKSKRHTSKRKSSKSRPTRGRGPA